MIAFLMEINFVSKHSASIPNSCVLYLLRYISCNKFELLRHGFSTRHYSLRLEEYVDAFFTLFFKYEYCCDCSFMRAIFAKETGANTLNRVQIGQLTPQIQHNSLIKAPRFICVNSILAFSSLSHPHYSQWRADNASSWSESRLTMIHWGIDHQALRAQSAKESVLQNCHPNR